MILEKIPKPETMKTETKEEPKQTTVAVLPSLTSIIAGILLTIIASAVAIFIAVALMGNSNLSWFIRAGIVAIIVGQVGIGGLTKIEIAHRGVPIFLGKRLDSFVLDEGWSWILPRPLMDTEAIDVRERTLPLQGGGSFTFLSMNNVRLSTTATVQWRVIHPYKLLSVGENTVSSGLHDAAIDALREQAVEQGVDDFVFVRSKEDLSERVAQAMKKLANRFGIEIVDVFVKDILPTNPRVLEAYEKLRIETEERAAERVERDLIIESIKKIAEETGVPASEAAIIFANERGKMKRQQLVIQSDHKSPLILGGNLLGDGKDGN